MMPRSGLEEPDLNLKMPRALNLKIQPKNQDYVEGLLRPKEKPEDTESLVSKNTAQKPRLCRGAVETKRKEKTRRYREPCF